MLYFIIIFTLLFSIFIECYFGSIIFRLNSENKIVFNVFSLLNFLYHPFHNSFLWNPKIIIGNYPFMLTIGIILYNIIYG